MWLEFRRQFVVYGAMLTAVGIARVAIGQLDGLMDFLAWEVVYLPLAALLALYVAWRGPVTVVHRKTRIVKSVLIGLAIPAAALALSWALQ